MKVKHAGHEQLVGSGRRGTWISLLIATNVPSAVVIALDSTVVLLPSLARCHAAHIHDIRRWRVLSLEDADEIVLLAKDACASCVHLTLVWMRTQKTEPAPHLSCTPAAMHATGQILDAAALG
jgi:hypothetical protein